MQGVKVEDLFKLKSITQPFTFQNQVFFVQNGVNEESNDYTADILSIDDQKQVHQWTDGGTNLSPLVCQNKLYYLHQDDEGRFQLMEMPIEGGVAKQLTNGDSISQLHLTNDQNNLVFKTVHTPTATKYTTSDRPKIRHIMKLQNRADGIGWLPNDCRYTLSLFDLKTHQTIELFTNRNDFSFQSISPDQTKILYIASTHPDWKTDFDDTKGVYLFNVDNQTSTFITALIPEGQFSDAIFSKDGRKIAFIGNTQEYASATANNLYMYDIENGNFTNVTEKYDDIDVGYSQTLASDFVQHQGAVSGYWTTDGRFIFATYSHAHSELYLWDGEDIEVLTDGEREIIDFTLIDDDHAVLCSSTPEEPSLLNELELETGEETTLYNPNAEYEKDHQYAQVEKFEYPSKDEQVTIDGWVMHGISDKEKRPVILYVHGGPHSAYGETFFHEFQALANNGFSIVYVNPRGSTTYGQDFEKAVLTHYGECDYDDVMAGFDYALAHFDDLDPNHVFIAGGSYGGFMSAWTIGHNNRFNAAIVQRPIIDWQSLYGTSDIGVRYANAELGCDLFGDAQAHDIYWKKSPLAYADRVKTPVRIQHGEYDMRCPVNQSEAFYTAVKRTGTDCDYIRYPQSYHGFSRTGLPNLRIQRIHDIMEWFNRYKA